MVLFISSYIADLVFGDPPWFLHPVKGMGRLINFLDNRLRGNRAEWVERVKGMILTISVVTISAMCAYLFLELSGKIHPLLKNIAWIFLAYTTIAIKDLFVHARRVLEEVKAENIIGARQKLGCMVGRDTHNLSKEEVIKATIESIAESTTDGIIAPLFYLILGGPVLAITYKAINTLDSMIGYKNERYLHFGWFSAKLDDVANFIPARISGVLISISSGISGSDFKEAFKVMFQDGRKHPSPNSGISEAALAGALGIRLGGPSTYKGKLSRKPHLGEDKSHASPLLINKALNISFTSSLLMVLLGVLLKWIM